MLCIFYRMRAPRPGTETMCRLALPAIYLAPVTALAPHHALQVAER